MQKSALVLFIAVAVFNLVGCQSFYSIKHDVEEGIETTKEAQEKAEDLHGRFIGKTAETMVQNGYDVYTGKWIRVECKSSNARIFFGDREYGDQILEPGQFVSLETKVFKDKSTKVDLLISVFEYDKEFDDAAFRYSYAVELWFCMDYRTQPFIANR